MIKFTQVICTISKSWTFQFFFFMLRTFILMHITSSALFTVLFYDFQIRTSLRCGFGNRWPSHCRRSFVYNWIPGLIRITPLCWKFFCESEVISIITGSSSVYHAQTNVDDLLPVILQDQNFCLVVHLPVP